MWWPWTSNLFLDLQWLKIKMCMETELSSSLSLWPVIHLINRGGAACWAFNGNHGSGASFMCSALTCRKPCQGSMMFLHCLSSAPIFPIIHLQWIQVKSSMYRRVSSAAWSQHTVAFSSLKIKLLLCLLISWHEIISLGVGNILKIVCVSVFTLVCVRTRYV